jgi:hypothetical protein
MEPAYSEAMSGSDSRPIWLAVLAAVHPLCWDWRSGRACYTNTGQTAIRIEPFGVQLQSGETIAVCWLRGDTAYSVEVLPS